MREKRSEDMQVIEEVFDKPTLMTVYSLLNRGYLKSIFGVAKSGKESRVYWGKSPEGLDLAVKIYLTTSTEFRQGMQKYIEGDPRFERVSKKTRSLIYTWARKEFDNLKLAEEAGVRVPRVITVEKNVLLMEFIGMDGMSAPLLKETPLKDPERMFQRIVEDMRKLYSRAGLVHGDFSEYNIMVWWGEPVIFDLSQAVKLDHPMADRFLRRDISNIAGYFSRIGVNVPGLEEIYRQVVGEGAEQAEYNDPS
ncbi:serine protein kinase RIO [Candidatus Bathyarchaeota archaeon]|nr:serine protein kinase RIO [Candidatus Bathyarchaeota archaeon]